MGKENHREKLIGLRRSGYVFNRSRIYPNSPLRLSRFLSNKHRLMFSYTRQHKGIRILEYSLHEVQGIAKRLLILAVLVSS